MSLSQEDQELVDRISAVSAEQFNACIAAVYEYQGAFNTWIEYQEEADFESNKNDPIPDADVLLDVVDKQALKYIRKKIQDAIAIAKKTGEDFNEDDIRQEVFLETFSDWLKMDLLTTHNVSAAMYDDIAAT